MKKLSKNIIRRLAVTASAAAVCTAVVFFSYRYMDSKYLPAMSTVKNDKPVIVLDAGHGESY